MTDMQLFQNERPGRAVARMAVPALLTSMISLLYNLTDTYFVGLLRDTSQLSAVSLSMPVMWAISALCALLSAGAPQVISLLMGAGEMDSARRARSFSLWGTLLLSVILTPAALLLFVPVLRLMGAQGDTLLHARRYLLPILLCSPITALQSVASGHLRTDGKNAQSGIGSIIGVTGNILLDPLFIFGFRMGVSGAAVATCLGSLMALVFMLFCLRKDPSLRPMRPEKKIVKRILAMSMASTVSTLITSLTVAFSYTLTSDFGDGAMAAVSVGSRLYSIAVTLISALCFSIQPFVGFNYSAGAKSRMQSAMKVCFLAAMSIGVTAGLLFAFAGDTLMALFSDDPSVLSFGGIMMLSFALAAPIAAPQMMANMYLAATGRAFRSLIAMMARQTFFLMPAMYIFRAIWGFQGIAWVYPVSDLLAGVLAVILCLIPGTKKPQPSSK